MVNVQWMREELVYQLIKKAFNNYKIIKHAQPMWLSPQHFDIYIPQLPLAIEYMGEQHYRPIDFFGGENGYNATIYRDKKKESICKDLNINLIHIKYSDNIKEKVGQINDSYNSSLKPNY